MQTQSPVPPSGTSSWLGRNWKWVVPLGCVSVLALVIAFVAGIVLVVFGFIRQSDVYQYALERASSNEAVVEALGEPIQPGWYVSGSIDVEGGSGSADLAIPISGPAGKGTLFVVARKSAGLWEYDVLEVEVDGRGQRIDLED